MCANDCSGHGDCVFDQFEFELGGTFTTVEGRPVCRCVEGYESNERGGCVKVEVMSMEETESDTMEKMEAMSGDLAPKPQATAKSSASDILPCMFVGNLLAMFVFFVF